MRILFTLLIVILGANFVVDLMDSSLVDVIQERNETIEKMMQDMWHRTRCPLIAPKPQNLCHTYSMENKANMITKGIVGKIATDPAFLSALEGLDSFVFDNSADLDMAYDWIADQTGIDSFVHDKKAFDLFYDAFDATQSLDD